MSCRFEDAYRRACDSYPIDQWNYLNPTSRSAAIYREMRRLDAADASANSEVPVLTDHKRAKVRMRSTGDQTEASLLVDVAGRD
jgi:hypothetical protein